jgi:hypothetical protein
MDKVKQGAEQARAKAQQGMTQGKAKLDQVQAKHQWDGLLRQLGAAVYAEQRQGGPAEAVTAALAALDEHVSVQGQAETGGEDEGSTFATTASGTASGTAGGTVGTAGGAADEGEVQDEGPAEA